MGETLERRLEGVDSARDFPSRIVKEADRLGFLVENILSFNRLEKTAVARNREAAPLSELVEEARMNLDAFTSKPVELRIARGEDVSLSVDAELVRLLLSNLMHNSCKYNAAEVVKITLEAAVAGPVVVVRHSDNGTGIPRDEWESVFTEFVRARNAGASGGFGLGLALCRRIMTLHDGSIRVAESGLAGTTFEMTFPAAVGASDPSARGAPA
jgi:K+-sensing histidine kinase KdpD